MRWAPTRARRSYARATDRLPPSRGEVALTFDDGPDPQFTPQVLDVLTAYRAKATFFVVGAQVRQYPELVLRIRREGHALGSHSATHPDARRLRTRHLAQDYADGRVALETTIGAPVALFRPPNGTLDTRGAVTIRRLGLLPWLWNVDPQDWHPDTTQEQIVQRCAAVTAGDVVLLHDGLRRPLASRARDRSATVRALPLILEDLRARGLRTCTLPAC